MTPVDWFLATLAVAEGFAIGWLWVDRRVSRQRFILEWQLERARGDRYRERYIKDYAGWTKSMTELQDIKAQRSESTQKGNLTKARNAKAKREAKTAELRNGATSLGQGGAGVDGNSAVGQFNPNAALRKAKKTAQLSAEAQLMQQWRPMSVVAHEENWGWNPDTGNWYRKP